LRLFVSRTSLGIAVPAQGIGGEYYDFITLDRANDDAARTSSRLDMELMN
jgi:hypothetical protein